MRIRWDGRLDEFALQFLMVDHARLFLDKT